MEAADELVGSFEGGVGEEEAGVRGKHEAVVDELGRSTGVGPISERKVSDPPLPLPLSNGPPLFQALREADLSFCESIPSPVSSPRPLMFLLASVAASYYQLKEVLDGYRQSTDVASRRRVKEAMNAALRSLPEYPPN